ncbi:MAG: ArnT family glycosyltransferase [Elusimicrobiales bacterium]
MGKYQRYAVPLIFLCFAASLAPWLYDFPLNDDWAYALAARTLAETGRLSLSDWGSATQLPHLLAGALSARVFGFSFAALRLATLLSAAGALFFFIKLLDEFEVEPFEKAAAALALAFTPLFLTLSNSYMTDVHYLFWMLAAAYFWARRLDRPEDTAALWLGGACAAAAYLTRQVGLAVPLAFSLALLLRERRDWRALAAAWALPAAATVGHYLWFTRVHGPTWASENYVGAATLAHLARPLPFLKDSIFRLMASMIETGLFLLPLAAGYALSMKKFCSRNGTGARVSAAGIWLALAVMGGFALFNGPLPYLENSVSSSGFGVLTLGGGGLKPSGLFTSTVFWTLATAAAVLSSVFLMCCSGLALRAGNPALRFLFAVCMAHLAVSLLGAKFFDRYLLTLLPWFAAAAVFAARGVKFSRPAAALALALYAALGWAGMKDYLEWNRAKWDLASRPRQGLAQGEIANGFDHDAWLNYERNMAYLKTMKPLKMIGEWEWQKINGYKAIVSYTPDQRYALLDKAEYSTPLSSRKGVIYLLAPQR